MMCNTNNKGYYAQIDGQDFLRELSGITSDDVKCEVDDAVRAIVPVWRDSVERKKQ